MNELDMDIRLIRRNLAKGFISEDAVDKMLADLPDVEDRGEWIDPEADDEIEAEADAETAATEDE
ncbi:MAG: hypothetical protein ACI9MR_001585 [Myxococcota bacterium]|jgi:hypothetical protein